MAANFLDRNKKKSLLAALLLFLRQRQLLVLLLLLVVAAMTIFLGPSYVSKWGLGRDGEPSYGNLLASFRAAKKQAGVSGNVGLGWGAFFGRTYGGGSSPARNSVDFV